VVGQNDDSSSPSPSSSPPRQLLLDDDAYTPSLSQGSVCNQSSRQHSFSPRPHAMASSNLAVRRRSSTATSCSSAAGSTPPSLLTLPSELQSHIALLLALSTPVGPPADLVPLLATHPILAATLGFEQNPALYAAILEGSWDIAPIRRRFLTLPPPNGNSGTGSSSYNPAPPLADARAQAAELRQRWATLRALREFGADGARWLQRQGGGLQAKERLERTMLDVFFLLTENGSSRRFAFPFLRLLLCAFSLSRGWSTSGLVGWGPMRHPSLCPPLSPSSLRPTRHPRH
jgi:hypothetical protein